MAISVEIKNTPSEERTIFVVDNSFAFLFFFKEYITVISIPTIKPKGNAIKRAISPITTIFLFPGNT